MNASGRQLAPPVAWSRSNRDPSADPRAPLPPRARDRLVRRRLVRTGNPRLTMNPAPLVLVSTAGPITTLTLNRPEKRNALNRALLEQLAGAIARAERDATQRILILRGAGPAFCAGLDLREASVADHAHDSAERLEAAFHGLATTRLVTLAAVHGAAVAGGAGLMCACDFALATREAKIGFPEVRRGIVPALIMTFLRRQLRERDLRELLLLGELITADRALAIGLLSRVVADAHALEAEINRVAESLLQGGPQTLAETKRLIAGMWPSSLAADFARARAVHLAARTAPEATEGFAAFNDKRPPKWTQ
jgi:methylglutaconyl-CoA hydratase